MEIKDIERGIIKIMEQTGMSIEENIDMVEDINLQDYIMDSMQFVSFSIELENFFSIILPDQFLIFDNFSSLKAVALNIQELLTK